MSRILILHASFGSGHRRAAEALRDALLAHPGVEVVVKDALIYLGPVLRRAVSALYRRTSEHTPRLYELYYTTTDRTRLDAAIRANLRRGRRYRPLLNDLERLIRRLAPDLIVGVQQVPLLVLSALRHEGVVQQPLYAVVTDFAAHSSWVHPYIDRYFLPHAMTERLLLQFGVAPEALLVTGIPISAEVTLAKERTAMRIRHGLPPDGPLVSLFGAGIVPDHVRTIISGILQSPTPLTLVCVAGRSRRLIKRLADLRGTACTPLVQLGQIDFVDDLAVASDLVITKAGGLIVSEMLARSTPLLIIDPIPGQEEWNADLVAATGAGLQLRMPAMAPPAVEALLAAPEWLALLRERAGTVGKPYAAATIAARLLADLRTHEH